MRQWSRAVLALVLAPCLSLPALAGHYMEDGSFSGTVAPEIMSAIADHPEGGPALADAIADIVAADPVKADDAAHAASTASDRVRSAMGKGLAMAQLQLGKSDGASADRIATVVSRAGPNVMTAFVASFSAEKFQTLNALNARQPAPPAGIVSPTRP